ncbi:hypothetical protein ABZX90_03880 [Streptomyces sp. NPDC002935]|uniref:hypothetical protein n=1 Tax=Streptomyces sp. NPDC002935 TaxID=3154545 RepID=UPI0033B9211A
MRLRRAVTALSVAAAAGVVPLVMAAPASATTAECRSYVAWIGYNVGPKVTAACEHHHITTPLGGRVANPACYVALVNAGLKADEADSACRRA